MDTFVMIICILGMFVAIWYGFRREQKWIFREVDPESIKVVAKLRGLTTEELLATGPYYRLQLDIESGKICFFKFK